MKREGGLGRTAHLRHHRRKRGWRDLFSLQLFAGLGPFARQPRKSDVADDGRRGPSAVLYYSCPLFVTLGRLFPPDLSSLPDDVGGAKQPLKPPPRRLLRRRLG